MILCLRKFVVQKGGVGTGKVVRLRNLRLNEMTKMKKERPRKKAGKMTKKGNLCL